MKTADLRHMKKDELHNELSRLERHLFDLRAQAVTEKLADPTQLGKTRRDIARVLTIMREHELSAGRTNAAPPQPAAASKPAAEKSKKPAAAREKGAPAKSAKPAKAKATKATAK